MLDCLVFFWETRLCWKCTLPLPRHSVRNRQSPRCSHRQTSEAAKKSSPVPWCNRSKVPKNSFEDIGHAPHLVILAPEDVVRLLGARGHGAGHVQGGALGEREGRRVVEKRIDRVCRVLKIKLKELS